MMSNEICMNKIKTPFNMENFKMNNICAIPNSL